MLSSTVLFQNATVVDSVFSASVVRVSDSEKWTQRRTKCITVYRGIKFNGKPLTFTKPSETYFWCLCVRSKVFDKNHCTTRTSNRTLCIVLVRIKEVQYFVITCPNILIRNFSELDQILSHFLMSVLVRPSLGLK